MTYSTSTLLTVRKCLAGRQNLDVINTVLIVLLTLIKLKNQEAVLLNHPEDFFTCTFMVCYDNYALKCFKYT